MIAWDGPWLFGLTMIDLRRITVVLFVFGSGDECNIGENVTRGRGGEVRFSGVVSGRNRSTDGTPGAT